MNVSQELRRAIITALKGDATLAGLITDIYDDVPPEAVMPYLSWSTEQINIDSADCIDSAEMFIDIDAWTKEIGYKQVSQITDAIRKVLHNREVALASNAVLLVEIDGIRHMRDVDTRVRHGVVTIRALVEMGA